MLVFLLGSNRQNNQVGPLPKCLSASLNRLKKSEKSMKGPKMSSSFFQNRRWSPAQAREFLHLHSTLALMTVHSDLTSQRTQGEARPRWHV